MSPLIYRPTDQPSRILTLGLCMRPGTEATEAHLLVAVKMGGQRAWLCNKRRKPRFASAWLTVFHSLKWSEFDRHSKTPPLHLESHRARVRRVSLYGHSFLSGRFEPHLADPSLASNVPRAFNKSRPSSHASHMVRTRKQHPIATESDAWMLTPLHTFQSKRELPRSLG